MCGTGYGINHSLVGRGGWCEDSLHSALFSWRLKTAKTTTFVALCKYMHPLLYMHTSHARFRQSLSLFFVCSWFVSLFSVGPLVCSWFDFLVILGLCCSLLLLLLTISPAATPSRIISRGSAANPSGRPTGPGARPGGRGGGGCPQRPPASPEAPH